VMDGRFHVTSGDNRLGTCMLPQTAVTATMEE
jgi:hypothetical protein